MNKKGFTLVELLAVIVILAVILVIAVPQVMDTIKNSKEAAFMSSVKLLASSAEKKYMEQEMLGKNNSIQCSDIVKLNNDDYEYCFISFDSNGKATVKLGGKGKFAGMNVCDGTTSGGNINNNLCETDESCFTFNNGEISDYKISCGKSIVIPKTIGGDPVTSIGAEAFSSGFYCEEESLGITNVLIPNSVTTIGSKAFFNNKLTNITIPNNVTTIESSAFANNQLTNITIPNSLKTIETSTFSNNQLTNVIIPNSVTTIESSAFANNQLTNITIPNSVTTIGYEAFRNNKIKEIIIPNSVTKIREAAFRKNQITKIVFPTNNLKLYTDTFQDNPIYASINYPSNVTVLTAGGEA